MDYDHKIDELIFHYDKKISHYQEEIRQSGSWAKRQHEYETMILEYKEKFGG